MVADAFCYKSLIPGHHSCKHPNHEAVDASVICNGVCRHMQPIFLRAGNMVYICNAGGLLGLLSF